MPRTSERESHRLSRTKGVKESSGAQAAPGLVGHPRRTALTATAGFTSGLGTGKVRPDEGWLIMQLQLQRHGDWLGGRQNARRAGRNRPTTPGRRPLCQRSDSTHVAVWPNRDPLGERGGANLYGFVYNNPLNLVDTDGRQSYAISGPGWSTSFQKANGSINSTNTLDQLTRRQTSVRSRLAWAI